MKQAEHATPTLIIGLTGGIGSGKSAAAERFIEHGVTVINADSVAREVVAPGSPALEALAERFGLAVLQEDGSLNRAKLRTIVFSNETDRRWLEHLTHPLVGEIIHQRLHAPQHKQDAPYRILESPLLLESGQHERVDRILLIDVPKPLQIERVITRDANSSAQINKIIESQMHRDEKLAQADDIVDNSGSLASLFAAVDDLHATYCKMANLQSDRS
jgi:dephospho-CoA kinase